MSPGKDPDKNLRNTLMLMLVIPAATCLIIGGIQLLIDPKVGAMLIALGVVLGIINYIILKYVLAKLDNEKETTKEP